MSLMAQCYGKVVILIERGHLVSNGGDTNPNTTPSRDETIKSLSVHATGLVGPFFVDRDVLVLVFGNAGRLNPMVQF